MNFHRVVCVSSRQPVCSPADVLAVCHSFPSRNAQSGIGGKLLCVGEQFFLLLEGAQASVEGLVQRIQSEVPEAGMTVRVRQSAEDRSFRGWSLEDVYLDELAHADLDAAKQLGDLMLDVLAPPVEAAIAQERSEADSAAEEVAEDESVDAESFDPESTDDDELDDPFAQLAALLDHFAATPVARRVPKPTTAAAAA
ncbi:MAG: BLUF domain-containing protein [Planctomycetota bacterium]